MAAAAAAPANSNAPAPPSGVSSGATGVGAISGAQFREIHKNTWLKRLTTDGKKLTVGPKGARMQEWVETLRSKLREMKILSPRENL
ncbi:uncharacterized protein LOC117186971 isoform X3 [Drosophila miranda]|nr:uncharacterized protein LOC117186967 isoform X3 [Drosophila miranda]XP_033244303.1 uncharacterized protein LOC117186968 isoform X3 [Drosophila miranda]XP_033244304.1 uncharacterized protein LOC117186968 isoform X4 [Drosophila miranda]XP_033244307.1 uncharacterized protein LOC117186969 isoform X3 [Drosophila miranda]XP_033244310.1 uncharacterized protein LOC117186971 isoform X3 [Drosophila miranda]